MVEVVGIDHIYIAVSDLAASERFYDLTLVNALAFRKNASRLAVSHTSNIPADTLALSCIPPALRRGMMHTRPVFTTSAFA